MNANECLWGFAMEITLDRVGHGPIFFGRNSPVKDEAIDMIPVTFFLS